MSLFRRGPKRASKVQERRLIKTAEKLAEDPLQVIPECRDSCLLCKFRRAKKYIKKIEKNKDDEKKLKKYSKRGPDLSKAVAGTLLLRLTEKASVLARAQTDSGELAYAKRGKAGKKRLIGIQHFEDPWLRLIAYTKEAKKGFYFYSWEDNLVCVGKEDKPPSEYIRYVIKDNPYDLKKDGEDYRCSHLSRDEDVPFFTLIWDSADIEFHICSHCAKKKENLFISLTKGMLSEDNSNSFRTHGKYRLECRSDCSDCRLKPSPSLSDDIKEAYFHSGISDRELISRYEQESWDKVKRRSGIYIVDGICYGKDKVSFAKQFDYESWEIPAVKEAVKNANGIVLKERTVNNLLKEVWEDNSLAIVRSITEDRGLAEEILEEYSRSEKIPRDILREAKRESTKKEKLSNIPEFENIPSKAELANEIAKVYKVKGPDEAVNYIERKNFTDTRIKSIAYAFLKAMGREGSKKWKYNESEIQSGEFLSEYVKKLLETEGEEYAQTLQELLKMSGSTSTIVLKDGKKLR